MTAKSRIVIADDHPIVRSGLRQIIDADPRFVVAGEANDGREAIALIEKLCPEIAILDVDMPNVDGFQAARSIREKELPVKTLFLTLHSAEDIFFSAMDLGACGYLLKQNAIAEIVPAIKAVSDGNFYVTPSLTSFLIRRRDRQKAAKPEASSLASLTKTERQILHMIAMYKSSKEIAEALFIHFRTVQNHRHNIACKLELTGHNALLKFALDNNDKL